jgi:hypothetical protein
VPFVVSLLTSPQQEETFNWEPQAGWARLRSGTPAPTARFTVRPMSQRCSYALNGGSRSRPVSAVSRLA